VTVRVLAGVQLNDVGRLIADIVGLAPNAGELYITSGMDGDHGPVSHHYGTLTYQGSPTAADDVGGGGFTAAGSLHMRDFARWVYETFPGDVVELIHTTPYADDQGFYIRHGVKKPNGTGWLDPATMAAHRNHAHLAMSLAGALAVKARLVSTLPKGGTVTNALFIDVSYHDWDRRGAAIDWAAVAAAGMGRVMCARASYGDLAVFSPPSPRFVEYMAGAKAAGFDCRGAYHNLIRGDQASVNRQVDLLRSSMDHTGAEWAMADVEAYPELVSRGLVPDWATIRRFHDRWYATSDGRVMAWYIARWFWEGRIGSPSLVGLRGPLFNAHYAGGDGTPRAIYAAAKGDQADGWGSYGGRIPDVLQFTSVSNVPGASSNTDCNAYRGSVAALVSLLTGATVPSGGMGDVTTRVFNYQGGMWVSAGGVRRTIPHGTALAAIYRELGATAPDAAVNYDSWPAELVDSTFGPDVATLGGSAVPAAAPGDGLTEAEVRDVAREEIARATLSPAASDQ
jgi:hypothetical protein